MSQNDRLGYKKQLLAIYKSVGQTLEEESERQDTDIVQGQFNYLCTGQLKSILLTIAFVFFVCPACNLHAPSTCSQVYHTPPIDCFSF